MPDTFTIPKQVTVSGETLYRAIRDVAEVREYVLNTFTLAAQFQRESFGAVAERLEELASSVRLDEATTGYTLAEG